MWGGLGAGVPVTAAPRGWSSAITGEMGQTSTGAMGPGEQAKPASGEGWTRETRSDGLATGATQKSFKAADGRHVALMDDLMASLAHANMPRSELTDSVSGHTHESQ